MNKPVLIVALFLFLSGLEGCAFFFTSFESASELDHSGKTSQAIEAYQNYLKHNPNTVLAPKIYYRIAKNCELESNYTDAIKFYEKVLSECPGSDEELHSLLDLAVLYRDKLKNMSAAFDYNQKAFNKYMDNIQIRDAIQSLLEAQYQTANALFLKKNYKQAGETAARIFQTYPSSFILPDARAKVESLIDRTRRAEAISKSSVELIVLRNETPFNKSFEGDFALDDPNQKIISSPDGNSLVSRKQAPNGINYLYLAKSPTKDDKVLFKLVSQTFGANHPSWSPNSQELVYTRQARGLRKLEKTNIKKLITQTLFFTKSNNLGLNPTYHPAGNKIAYIYEGEVWLINADGIYKSGLKTNQKLDYTAALTWSTDGTMIRCRQTDKHGNIVDKVLVLDVSATNNP